MTTLEKDTIEHHWKICGMCGPMVICGACGNNACNGGYGDGDGPDGRCVHCPSAYEMMSEQFKRTFNVWRYYQTKGTKRKESEAMWGPQPSARKRRIRR